MKIGVKNTVVSIPDAIETNLPKGSIGFFLPKHGKALKAYKFQKKKFWDQWYCRVFDKADEKSNETENSPRTKSDRRGCNWWNLLCSQRKKPFSVKSERYCCVTQVRYVREIRIKQKEYPEMFCPNKQWLLLLLPRQYFNNMPYLIVQTCTTNSHK